MFDRHDARRPAQVNACFEGETSRRDEIVAALQQAGLAENQITVIDRPAPEDVTVETSEPTFLERIKSLFGGGEEEEEERDYDLLILAHLGDNESLAGPVQEIFQRFDAARVNYYPPAEAEMHVLGEAAPSPTIEPPAGSSGTAGEDIEQTVTDRTDTSDTGASPAAPRTSESSSTTATAGAARADAVTTRSSDASGTSATTGTTDAEGRRVEPGGLDTTETTRAVTSSGEGERIEPNQEVVYRGDPAATVVDATEANRTGGDASGGAPRA